MTSPVAAEAVALLHGGRAKMEGEGNYRVWNYENDTYGKAAHLHAWTFGSADDFQIENAEGELTYLKGDFGLFPYTRAKGNGTEQVFLQVLFPTAQGNAGPQVSAKRDGQRIVVTVKDGNLTDHFLLQPSTKLAVVGGVETDATFAWVREDGGKATKYFVREGSYLKANGTELLKEQKPITVAKEK